MITVKVQVKGMDRAFKATLKVPKATREGIRQGFFLLGRDLKATTLRLINTPPKTGAIRTVRFRGRRFRHRSSAPGEAPAVLTGNLRGAIDYDVRGSSQMEFGALAAVGYARSLELGDASRNLAPRPFLTPSVDENTARAQNAMSNSIARALGKL